MNLCSYFLFSSFTSKYQTACVFQVSVLTRVRNASMYSVHACHASFSLAVGDGGATAQLDDHLLAVVEGPLVSQLLQGARCICQHAHPLAGSRQKRGRKVAARQHHGLRLLPLARPRLALLCTQHHKKTLLPWYLG